jgi:lactate permease
MEILLAAIPILTLLTLMSVLHWSGQRAGPVSWLVGIGVAVLFFGLSPQVLWVSQVKGLLFSIYVLAVLWPALLLYHIVNLSGGVRAVTETLAGVIRERGILLIVVAWAFSSILEGLAGFGLPIAVAAPILVGLGVDPLTAVAATAVGHAWSVTFGNMGVVFQTLISLSGIEGDVLVFPAALMLGLACLACGLGTAFILGQKRHWQFVIIIGVLMALVQYALAAAGLAPLASLGGALTGVAGGMLVGSKKGPQADRQRLFTPPLAAALGSYGLVAVLLALISFPGPVHDALYPILWRAAFPAVTTLKGFVSPQGYGQTFRILAHPGSITLVAILLSYPILRRLKISQPGTLQAAAMATWRSALPATIGVTATVGLSTLMEHCGMTLLLAQGLSAAAGSAYPIFSPLVGMLGAFATGSNTNSNVLFVSLQKNIALLLAVNPILLLSAQTTGGALGSMISPSKLIVGCSTVGLNGKEGEALRRTLPYGLGIGLLVGLLTMGWVLFG